jgi:hypothetical protein
MSNTDSPIYLSNNKSLCILNFLIKLIFSLNLNIALLFSNVYKYLISVLSISDDNSQQYKILLKEMS